MTCTKCNHNISGCPVEVVEVCPHCDAENVYTNYCADLLGYRVTCKECGASILLCDECFHADDNKNGYCDWHDGTCFRDK